MSAPPRGHTAAVKITQIQDLLLKCISYIMSDLETPVVKVTGLFQAG